VAPRRPGLFSLILPRGSARKSAIGRKPMTFARIWVACLPLSIAAVAAAILLSGGDPERRPFAIFGVGIALGVIGLVSLFVGLIQAGNLERARRRARDAARAKDHP
jgi:Na+/melibiose symporter-like transporter